MLPVLLKPKLLAFRNSIRGRNLFSSQNLRDLIVVFLALVVMIILYRGTTWTLRHINSDPYLIYLPPLYPLGMIFALLFLMLSFSCVAFAVGTLYLSEDMDLVLSAPVSKPVFFSSKVLYIALASSWMPAVFVMPLLAAFGVAYGAPADYYYLSLIAVFPFFLIPAGISVMIATALARFVPASRARQILFMIVLLFLAVIYFIADLIRLGFHSAQDLTHVSKLMSFLSVADIDWLPSNWLAHCLQDLIYSGTFNNISYPAALYLSALALLSLAHLAIHIFHFRTYSDYKSGLKRSTRKNRTLDSVSRAFSFLRPNQNALIRKEIACFTRDVSQTVQLLMLLGLSLIYIFNLRIFLSLESFPIESRDWWKSFFFLSNCAIAAFVATGFCTRFVFTSVSLEGSSLWILQNSPLSLREVLNAKFALWYFPVSLLSGFVFAAAAISIGLQTGTVVLSVIASCLICYGIVGLAIGLGARFANFQWEHSSQLVAGFGSIVFMLASITLIIINTFPIGMLFFSAPPAILSSTDIELNKMVFITGVFFAIFCLNYYTKKAALRFGERALVRRMTD